MYKSFQSFEIVVEASIDEYEYRTGFPVGLLNYLFFFLDDIYII